MKAAKLVESAREAADVRAHQTNPNVVALNVERIRTWVNVFFWTGITLGLTFTMANVQQFASDGGDKWSIEWLIAWFLDPMVSLPLLGVLIGEQVLTRYNVESGAWVHIVKWVTLSCTYAMNTWQAWAAQDPAKILLHSVPPLVVVCAAEGLTDLRHRITVAVTKAVEAASADTVETVSGTTPGTVSDTAQDIVSNTVLDTIADTVPDTTPTRSDPVSNTPENTVSDTAGDTAGDTMPDTEDGEKKAPKPRPRKTSKRRGAPVSRTQLARQIYDTHKDEHGTEPAIAELMRQLKDAGHPTGNKTAAALLDEIRRNPLRVAN